MHVEFSSKATTTTATHIVGGIRRRMAKKSSFIKYSNLLKIITQAQAHLHGLLCSVFGVVYLKSRNTHDTLHVSISGMLLK